eukprot:6204768-Pleurochrysis_carterae.AAC.3
MYHFHPTPQFQQYVLTTHHLLDDAKNVYQPVKCHTRESKCYMLAREHRHIRKVVIFNKLSTDATPVWMAFGRLVALSSVKPRHRKAAKAMDGHELQCKVVE